jgi:hypothetical protein
MLESDTVADWLRRHHRRQAALRFVGALGLLLGGVLMTFITFGIIYAVISFIFDRFFHFSYEARFWTSMAIVALLFPISFFTDHREMEEGVLKSTARHDPEAARWMCLVAKSPSAWRVLRPMPVSNAGPAVWARFYSVIVLIGPRMLLGIVPVLLEGFRLRQYEVEDCAAMLTILARRSERVPLEEAVEELPPGSDVPAIAEQLQTIPGVITLQGPPPALKLTRELLDELRPLVRGGTKTRGKKARRARMRDSENDEG